MSGASLTTYNSELVKALEDLREQREEKNRSILRAEEEKGRIQKELTVLTERLGRLNEDLTRKLTARNEYDAVIGETEAAYMKVRRRRRRGGGGRRRCVFVSGVEVGGEGGTAVVAIASSSPSPCVSLPRRRSSRARRRSSRCSSARPSRSPSALPDLCERQLLLSVSFRPPHFLSRRATTTTQTRMRARPVTSLFVSRVWARPVRSSFFLGFQHSVSFFS